MRVFEFARLEQPVDLVNPFQFFFLKLLSFELCLDALDVELEPRMLGVHTSQGVPLPQSVTQEILLLVLASLCDDGVDQVPPSSQTARQFLKVWFFRISTEGFFQKLDAAIEIG